MKEEVRQLRPPMGGEVASVAMRWVFAGAIVVAAHAAGAWMLMANVSLVAEPRGAPAAILIDLAPLPVSPETPLQEIAPGPPLEEIQPPPAPVEERVAEPKEEPPARDADQPVDDPMPEIPLPSEAPIRLPEPVVEKAEAVLPPSRPPETVKSPEKKPPVKKPPVERQKPVPQDKREQTRMSAPPVAQGPVADRAAAPSAGSTASASVSPQTWRSSLAAHLNRHKRFPVGASGAGTTTVAFSINRSGQVLSARLIQSSGDSILDQEAVALVHRASPVPSPPPDFNSGSTTVTLTVPIRFSR